MTNYPNVNDFGIGFQPICFSNSVLVSVSESILLKPVILALVSWHTPIPKNSRSVQK